MMIELIAIIFLAHRIGDLAAEKGYVAWHYKLLMISLWLVLEFIFLFSGVMLFGQSIPVYLFGIFGGVTGYLITALKIKSLPNKFEKNT
jgi:hypothetical protein